MHTLTRRQVISRACATSLGLAAAGTVRNIAGQPATPDGPATNGIEALDAFAMSALASFEVPGAAVAVVQDGEPVLVKGYGVRNMDSGEPADADTVFQLASNTKVMTSFVAGTLVEEGVLGWDEPIVGYLPELQLMDPYATQHVTLRDVFAHRSGLPEFYGDMLGHLGYDRAEMLRRLRFVEPSHTFRERAAYSNLGYFIAGEVISRVTGAPWEEAMRERLFSPLGMDRSTPSSVDDPADGNIAAAHGDIEGVLQVVPRDTHGVHGSAGSAMSTANDLTRWMQMLLANGEFDGQSVMAPDAVRELFEPVIAADMSFTETPPINESTGFSFALGWGVFHYGGYEVLEKGGALAGVRTVLCLVPELNAGIAVVANRNLTFLPEAVRAFALEQWLGAPGYDMQAEIVSRKAIIDQVFTPQPPPENPLSPTVPVEALAGTYTHVLFGDATVIAEGEEMRLESGPAKVPATFRHLSRETYLLDWGTVTTVPEAVTFVIGPEGLATAFEFESGDRYERIDA